MVQLSGYETVIENAYEHRQDHVFEYWDSLNNEEKRLLCEDLKAVDFDLMKEVFQNQEHGDSLSFKPAPYVELPYTHDQKRDFSTARKLGDDFIRRGKVAAFVVAGGQGSRLGYDGPKGKFPIGPVSGKTIFAIQAERIIGASQEYEVAIPWLIMTSPVNHDETCAYFKEENYFGLPEDQIHIFPQTMIPSLDREGNLVLKNQHRLFTNPDGHGGSLYAIESSGVLAKLEQQGIELISYFQVDNPLVRIIDPVFIGFHVMKNAQVSSKAVSKVGPEEKVGVFAKYENGRIGVVEYSDLSEQQAHKRDDNGKLIYSSGSIAIHLFDLDFVKKITTKGSGPELPYHTAKKKIPAYVNGEVQEIDGLKFEKFVFDALLLTERNIVLETRREVEFAPVKNATGADSVESSRELICTLHKTWCKQQGIEIPEVVERIEISPILAQEAGDLPMKYTIPAEKDVYLEG